MRTALAFASALLLAGCATPYQASSFGVGYTETQLAPDVYRVDYAGNEFTDAITVQDFGLLRGAELALQNGFKYFVIVDEKAWSDHYSYSSPGTTYATVTNNAFTPPTVTTHTYGAGSYSTNAPRSSNTIHCFKDRPADNSGVIYDADFLVTSLKTKYKLP